MRILSVVGARPQFIKAAPVHRALSASHDITLVHTGQHYDDNMSGIFFRELSLPAPDVHLGVGSGSHAQQTAAIFERLEPVMISARPAWVIVYGDTNTTLAAAVVAAKLVIPVAHVEAGLRSFKRTMPEEQNRVVADHLSSLLLCPTETAVGNLSAEGITRGVHLVGDVMAEALTAAAGRAQRESRVLERLGVTASRYALATVHRAENTDDRGRLRRILEALNALDEPVVFPMHPRTRAAVDAIGWSPRAHVHVVEPQGYLDMVKLEASARVVLTDSGGVQKEAFWLGVPCVTLREETEWVETLEHGWNVLAGTDPARIIERARAARDKRPPQAAPGGDAPSHRIAALLSQTR